MQFKNLFNTATQWFSEAPERALDRAYSAAIKIKEIEDKHFNGQKVSSENSDYGESVIEYFQNEVNGHLQAIRKRLTEFKAGRLFMNLSELKTQKEKKDSEQELPELMLGKIQFIDEVLARYNKIKINDLKNGISRELVDEEEGKIVVEDRSSYRMPTKKSISKPRRNPLYLNVEEETSEDLDTVSDKTGVLPRSFINTLNRIKNEMAPQSPESEEEVVRKFRLSRYKTRVSIIFILLLIVVPLATRQIVKISLTEVIAQYFNNHQQIVFLNQDLEEEAFIELKHFEEALHFKSLIGLAPEISTPEIEEKVKEKAQEISKEYRNKSIDAVANVFADIASAIAFAIVILKNRKDIIIIKSFLDNIVYSLSDSAKAFLIILFTDMFVGFHSPHGWEVLLEGVARHFGLPENREFNGLFIATFPVILDTVFKYWIFRYLNRLSPSAVATYRNMNE
jgi:hypothetical protein